MVKAITNNLIHISVTGVVQGVGFRPSVYQLATKYNLKGWVCNASEDVKIEVEGEAEAIEQFLVALREQAPPRATIENITITRCSQNPRFSGPAGWSAVTGATATHTLKGQAPYPSIPAR